MIKYMRFFFAIILGMMFFPGRVVAQEDNVTTDTSALQEGLSTLKQSVEKLSLGNDQLAARDNAAKEQILHLQAQLGRLQAQGDLLNKAAAKLRDQNPRRARQIARLEKENSDLDNRIQKAESRITLVQPPGTQAVDGRQKEKLKLMKMIYDSQQRQEWLHEAILEFQKNTPSANSGYAK